MRFVELTEIEFSNKGGPLLVTDAEPIVINLSNISSMQRKGSEATGFYTEIIIGNRSIDVKETPKEILTVKRQIG